MENLKPCPFCGSVDIGYRKREEECFVLKNGEWKRSTVSERFQIHCRNCPCETYYGFYMEDVVEAWNRRMAKMCMKVPIHIAKDGRLEPAGYAEVEAFDAEELWHLCNWSCYQKERPENLFSEIDYCGHGICFTNPETNQKWLALSVGWYVTDDMQKIEKCVSKNAGKHVWRKVD